MEIRIEPAVIQSINEVMSMTNVMIIMAILISLMKENRESSENTKRNVKMKASNNDDN
jgi:hypothetical protein